MTIAVVGKSSFLAQELARHPGSRGWRFLSHQEALKGLDDVTTVINFAFAPEFRKGAYEVRHDIDTALARLLGSRPVHYVMISSRAVYGLSENAFGLKEEQEPRPTTAYGASKLEVERSLTSLLPPERLTILRLSNVFGFEPGRTTFFGMMMSTLAREGVIRFDMHPDTRREFWAVEDFVESMMRVAASPRPGTFNLSSGLATRCGDVAAWLIEGYGSGRLEVTQAAIRDQYSLDVSKAQSTWNLEVTTIDRLRNNIVGLGRRLRQGDQSPR